MNIKDFAKTFVPPQLVCINCGKILKYYNTQRCRPCWKIYYKENYNLKVKSGKDNINWKGDDVGYDALHDWIRSHKPKPEVCEICKKAEPKQVANISGKYKRDIDDYQWLCARCHVYKDGTINNLKHRQIKTKLNSMGG